MITEQQFVALLTRAETETLDFKSGSYELVDEDGRFALVKDVICMANTPRENTSHIVLGVRKHVDATFDLLGLPTQLDDANVQSQFTERIYPLGGHPKPASQGHLKTGQL